MAIKRMSPKDEQGTGENHAGEEKRDARPAPPAEKDGTGRNQSPNQSRNEGSNQSSADNGVLQVDTGQLKLPQDLTEEEEEVKRFLPIDPAVLVLLCLSLIFIGTIAYVIWNCWEPPQR